MSRPRAIVLAVVALFLLLGVQGLPRRSAPPAWPELTGPVRRSPAALRSAASSAGAPACASDVHVQVLASCLEGGRGPDACVEDLGGPPLCDSDGDELGDDLEDALALAYGPVFAMNGGRYGGDPEPAWPTNIDHFLARARLVLRRDGAPEVLLDPSPTAASIGLASARLPSGRAIFASDPRPGNGPDFWLCINDRSAQVESAAAMEALPGGIDLEVVAHPASGLLSESSHLFVNFTLFWAHNLHSYVDDHEGDREGVSVFVDRKTGAVDAVQFERHASLDEIDFVDAQTFGAKDPRRETHFGAVSWPGRTVHGLRFDDYEGPRHHVVAYLAAGGHAPYDYPADTFILWQGPRDSHGGDGAKLFTAAGEIADTWDGSRRPVRINRRNPGEPDHVLLPWARFRGQWGCDDERIARSWPGPFGNARHPRTVFERRWARPAAPLAAR